MPLSFVPDEILHRLAPLLPELARACARGELLGDQEVCILAQAVTGEAPSAAVLAELSAWGRILRQARADPSAASATRARQALLARGLPAAAVGQALELVAPAVPGLEVPAGEAPASRAGAGVPEGPAGPRTPVEPAAPPRRPVPGAADPPRPAALAGRTAGRTYQENPFAVLGLAAQAAPVEIRQRAEELLVEAELSGADGGPIREAAQALEDAPTRLLHELLWLWRADAPAIAAVQRGDGAALTAAYRNLTVPAAQGDLAAMHDAAVLAHARAVYAGDQPGPALEALWREALARWQQLLTGGALDAWVQQRAAALADPRLTPAVLQDVQRSAAAWVLGGLVERARADIEAGQVERCQRWLDLIGGMATAAPDVAASARQRVEEAALEAVLEACDQGSQRLQGARGSAGDGAQLRAAVAEADAALTRARQALSALRRLAESMAAVAEACDRVADLAHTLAVVVHNELQQYAQAILYLELALGTAQSTALRRQYEEERRRVRQHACAHFLEAAAQAAAAGRLAEARQLIDRAAAYVEGPAQWHAVASLRSSVEALAVRARRRPVLGEVAAAGAGCAGAWTRRAVALIGLAGLAGGLRELGRAGRLLPRSGSSTTQSSAGTAARQQRAALQAEIDRLKGEIDRAEEQLRALEAKLQRLKAQLDSIEAEYRGRGAPESIVRWYEDLRQRYNALVDEYHAAYARYRALIAEHNEKVDAYNRLVRGEPGSR